MSCLPLRKQGNHLVVFVTAVPTIIPLGNAVLGEFSVSIWAPQFSNDLKEGFQGKIMYFVANFEQLNFKPWHIIILKISNVVPSIFLSFFGIF